MDIHTRFLYEEQIFDQLEVEVKNDDLLEALDPDEEWQDDVELSDDFLWDDDAPAAMRSLDEDDQEFDYGDDDDEPGYAGDDEDRSDHITVRFSRPLGEPQ